MSDEVFGNAIIQLGEAIKKIDISDKTLEILKQPKRSVEVNFPVKMDNGRIKVFKGFRVLHNDSIGPGKGGIRFHPNVSLDEVKALSFWMTMKTSVIGIPYGGAKGGVIVNPKELSKKELESLSRGYVKAIYENIGQYKDVPAPDVYTTEEIMDWMQDEYDKISKKKVPGVFTGKSIKNGGIVGRSDATGVGGFYIIQELVKTYKLNPEETTITIQGFGNAGSMIAENLYDEGFKIIAISDSSCAVFNDKGINPYELLTLKKKYKELNDAFKEKNNDDNKDLRKISNEELLELKTDILIPAALESVLTEKNASKVKAKFIVEIANGPTTPEAEKIFEKKGIHIIPDILANAGGVTVSYFEWVQNTTNKRYTKDEVYSDLKELMSKAFKDIHDIVESKKTSYRTAAYITALQRIDKAINEKIE